MDAKHPASTSLSAQQQKAQKKEPLSEFTKLSETIYYLQSTVDQISNAVPTLIVICAWMGAQPRHISKYTLSYQRLYPTASILVIQSTLTDVLLRPSSLQQTAIKPAADVVLREQEGADAKILLHVFSNGGVNTAAQLATAVMAASGEMVELVGVVLDSCPSLSTPARTVKAVSASLPNSFLTKHFVPFLMHIYLFIFGVLTAVFGVQGKVEWAIRALNDGKVFAVETPRLYIYSKADEMILWKHVQDHAEEARKAGYKKVFALPFEKSAHCAHVMADPDRYWGAVKELMGGEK